MSPVADAYRTLAIDDALRPLVRRRFLLRTSAATGPLAPTASRIGGAPYLTKDEAWPGCTTCAADLSFIAQVDLRAIGRARPGMDLFAFYYCWDCFPFDGPWDVRAYVDPRDDLHVPRTPREGVDQHPAHAVWFEEVGSLPAWEDGALEPHRELFRASDSPWELYNAAVARLVGEQDITSAIGGWPTWIQSDDTPDDAEFLAQFDSLQVQGISWGSCGLAYLWLSRVDPPEPIFVMQSL